LRSASTRSVDVLPRARRRPADREDADADDEDDDDRSAFLAREDESRRTTEGADADAVTARDIASG
jgi:hypothetical protein